MRRIQTYKQKNLKGLIFHEYVFKVQAFPLDNQHIGSKDLNRAWVVFKVKKGPFWTCTHAQLCDWYINILFFLHTKVRGVFGRKSSMCEIDPSHVKETRFTCSLVINWIQKSCL